jgi:hypothetical protein
MRKRRIYKAHPICRWRTSWSRAHSSRMYHTSDPVSAFVLKYSTMADRPVRLCRRSLTGEGVSPRIFGFGFLQTPPHDDTLALLLTFGSANTWCGDSHPTSYVPCLAHTWSFRGAQLFARPAESALLGHYFKCCRNHSTAFVAKSSGKICPLS